MPRYLIQGSYTAESWNKMIQRPQNRREAIQPLVEAVGGRLEACYLSFGEYDFCVIAEVEDAVTEAALAVATVASGAFKSFKTTVLLTPEEGVEAMKRAGSIRYTPPS